MDTTTLTEANRRLVNCYPVHEVGYGRSGITYRMLGGCCGDPEVAYADAVKAGAEFLLIHDVRTLERWYVPIHDPATTEEN